MQTANIEEREKLVSYRNRAKKIPSWENRFLQEKDIILLLARILPETPSLTLAEAMKEDLRNMSLYNALASWCDPETGLGKFYPKQILQVAEKLIT
jgi:hypothetical protein